MRRSHFAKVLSGDDEGDRETGCTQVNTEETQPESSEHLGKPISREEVQWALNEVKKDAAPRLDGVVMDMMLTERLFEVWVALFEFCWEYGRVPSLWRESIVVPVPKKQVRGVCDVNTFWGISLTSLVSKVVCKILENRLSRMAEEKGLSKGAFGRIEGAGINYCLWC